MATERGDGRRAHVEDVERRRLQRVHGQSDEDMMIARARMNAAQNGLPDPYPNLPPSTGSIGSFINVLTQRNPHWRPAASPTTPPVAAPSPEQVEQQLLQKLQDDSIAQMNEYFTSQGLDPAQYSDAIRSHVASTAGRIPSGSSNPETYFQNLGQQLYDLETNKYRTGLLGQIDEFAPSGFELKRILDTSDDPFLEEIMNEQFGQAEGYLNNLRDRGVVTDIGYDRAYGDLSGQKAGAFSRLNDVGMGILNTGRTGASNMANQARSSASGIRLGTPFDVSGFQGGVNTHFNDFFNNLGQNLRNVAPTNLFNTSGLAGVAGSAQRAGNTAFDPNAVAGTEEDDRESSAGTSPF